MQHAIYSALLNDFSNLTIDKIKVDITEVIAARKTVLGDGYEWINLTGLNIILSVNILINEINEIS